MDIKLTVTVYSLPACQGCRATYKALDRIGVPYTSVDLAEDPEAYAYVQSLGHNQAPIVVAGEDHWSGHRVDKIKALSEAS